MKPPLFSYARAESVEEALGLLASYGDEAKLLAGGQSLIPLLNLRMSQPAVLVDINSLASLEFIRQTDGASAAAIEIGALTRHRQLELAPMLRAKCPLLVAAARHIGHPQIRNRGTMGGSLAHADPSAELPLAVVTLGGEVGVTSRQSRRVIPAERFFQGLWETSLQPDEMIEWVRVPQVSREMGWSFKELTHRAGDFAVVAVGVLAAVDDDGHMRSCRVAISGADARPLRLRDVEQRLEAAIPAREVLRNAAHLAERIANFRADLRGSAEYRRDAIVHMLEDALIAATRVAQMEVA
jgi:2-furoyl-CoA dehydrogenase FAD binding subunit